MFKNKRAVEIISQSVQETQKIAGLLAGEIKRSRGKKAAVVALAGNLGSGKTTFAQGFAEALGVKEKVLSPTFVLMKIYGLHRGSLRGRGAAAAISRKGLLHFARNDGLFIFHHLIHIDCYRLDSPKDLLHLGFKDLLNDKDALIIIEWADKIKNLLPRHALWLKFKHGKKPNERILQI